MAFCVSLKQVIGGGVVALTGPAIAATGSGAALSYGLAALVVLLVSLPYAVLGAARPASGSLYRWPARFISPSAGFLAFWMVLGTHVGLGAYALTFGEAVHLFWPFLPPVATGAGALLAVLALNLSGATATARTGIVVTAGTVLSLIAFVAFGLPHLEPRRLLPLLPHGVGAMLGTAAMLSFPLTGATLVSELSGEMRRPGRDVPIAILGATAAAALIYVAVTLVAAALPSAGRSLADSAAEVMPPPVLALFELGAGVVSMLGIINAHMMWGSRSILTVCQDNWLPRRFARLNRAGAPVWPLCLLAAIGLVPLLGGLDIASAIRVSGLGAGGSAILSVLCAALFARREPKALVASPLPVRPVPLSAACALAIAGQVAIIGLLCRDLAPALVGGWIAWMAIGAALAGWRRRGVTVRFG
ncbi:APC family permease [Rhizosaccharibacter radicis]|uniref:APC family permease n=1 Tax=Rhizosaccharibacter radicis TaxID=2782605 RepID=A0ABT1VU30_9PROT|nr:APC family permease [Acetobacteraceae bacterium KSS12]